MNIKHLPACLAAALFSVGALAKLPPAPPPDPVAVAAKAEKDKATAEKGKALQATSEDKAVKNFQENMKKAGKPVPKPTPITVVAAPTVSPVPAAIAAKGVVPAKDAKPVTK